MKLQTEKNTGLKSLADLKVIKRDGTETPFYAYKLNLIFKSLDAEWAKQQSVCQALSQAFKDQASATTVEIAEGAVAHYETDRNFMKEFVNFLWKPARPSK